jgi:hypothetical protein
MNNRQVATRRQPSNKPTLVKTLETLKVFKDFSIRHGF